MSRNFSGSSGESTIGVSCLRGWEVWYVGGARYRSDKYSWEELPDDGVLFVKVYLTAECGSQRTCYGADWYFKAGDLIGACPEFLPLEESAPRYPGAVWKRGKWTMDDEMARVRNEANAAKFEDEAQQNRTPRIEAGKV